MLLPGILSVCLFLRQSMIEFADLPGVLEIFVPERSGFLDRLILVCLVLGMLDRLLGGLDYLQ